MCPPITDSPTRKQPIERPLARGIRKDRLWLIIMGVLLVALRARDRLAPPPVCEACDRPGNATCSSRIPRIIHQSYKTAELPARWAKTPEQWRKHHPDFEYRFWSDFDNRELIRLQYPWMLETYDSYPFPIQRADAARYFVILTYGGVYADLDVKPLRDISELLCKVDRETEQLLVAETPNLGLTNAFFAGTPQSEPLLKLVHKLPSLARPWGSSISPHLMVMLSAGTTRFWRFIASEADQSMIETISVAEWGACSLCKSVCSTQENAFFEHVRGNSWHALDTVILNWLSCHPACIIWILIITLSKARERQIARRQHKPPTPPPLSALDPAAYVAITMLLTA